MAANAGSQAVILHCPSFRHLQSPRSTSDQPLSHFQFSLFLSLSTFPGPLQQQRDSLSLPVMAAPNGIRFQCAASAGSLVRLPIYL